MNHTAMFKRTNVTLTHEDAKASLLAAALKLLTDVVAASLCLAFYVTQNERTGFVAALVTQVLSDFVAHAALKSRKASHLRCVPLLLLAELATLHDAGDMAAWRHVVWLTLCSVPVKSWSWPQVFGGGASARS